MKKISVFVCGVQKGGTTSLHAHFCEHPSLSPPCSKELHFFDDDSVNWASPDFSSLDSFFPPNDEGRLRFDMTPIYMFWPRAIERIHAYNPSAKLIFLFRDPFERAYSHWCMEYARGAETLPFSEAIREGRRRMEETPSLGPEIRTYSYVERGFYSRQMNRVLAIFPREQMLFLRSSDFSWDHVATLERVSRFLSIPPFPASNPKHEFMRADITFPSVPTDEDRDLIAQLLGADLCEFSRLTGLDISDWPTMRRLEMPARG